MSKSILAAFAAVFLIFNGCAAFKPMTPEERAAYEKKMEAQRLEEQRQTRFADNSDGLEIRGNLYAVAGAAQAIMQENGYATSTQSYRRGPGAGMIITGIKNQKQALGTSIGMNLLAGALNNSGNSIIDRHEQATTVWLWGKWNAQLNGPENGVLMFKNNAVEYDVNQGGQVVNKRELGLAAQAALRDGIVQRLKQ